MSEAPPNPCATCGACCRSYVVNVCGYDVWLISVRQRLSPEQFVVALERESASLEAFRLEHGGPTYALMLDKRGRIHPQQPCVFLVRLADGTDRCGIYAERPVVCQSYPMGMWSNVVFQRNDTLCPPGSWPLASVVRPSWRTAMQRLRMHYDIYHEVVARWNARVAAAGPGAQFSLAEFYSYLLNVYDRLAALDDEVGEADLAQVQATWGALPERDPAASELRVRPGEFPWLDYVARMRQVVDGFYPEVEPLPLVALRPAGPAAAPPEVGAMARLPDVLPEFLPAQAREEAGALAAVAGD